MLEDKEFELLDESPATNEIVDDDVVITDSDFELTEVDSTVHEQKFQTKPTTFLKDSIKRFGKNKSSVVAAYILGALLILSFTVPLFDHSNTKDPHPYETYLAPKLFKAGTGWWDGTVSYKNIAVDISAKPDAKTDEEKQEYWWPSKDVFSQRSAISKKKFTDEQYTNDVSTLGTFGKEGYVHFGYYYNAEAGENVDFSSQPIAALSLEDNLYLTKFDTYDVEKIRLMEGKDDLYYPENYDIGQSALYFIYSEENTETHELEEKEEKLVDYAVVHNIGTSVESAKYAKEEKVDVAKIIKDETGKDLFENAYFAVRMVVEEHEKHNRCSLIRGIGFESESTDAKVKQMFEDMSFSDATGVVTTTTKDGYKYWSSTGVKKIFLSKAYFCSFVYDTYEAAFGDRVIEGFSIFHLLDFQKRGWVSFDDADGIPTLWLDDDGFYFDAATFKCTILDPVHCPLASEIVATDFYGYDNPGDLSVKANVSYFKYLKYKDNADSYAKLKTISQPSYLMGSDKSGQDMFKYVFEGLRTSLLLGIITFLICFTIGLIWGSISGYFGGTVDLVMERITDILAYIPGIVLMTLMIIHLGSNFRTFLISMCATGWIGTAGLTRTQFYRFRGREYVLASRTLGASDARLIYKHILPNGLGTIITASVLMIPSVIFTEASISYLGLGLKNMSSLGVILSDNQSELLTNPYLLIFPAIVIALIMISFNLFGNGLRDAVNPSLKGEE